MRLLLASLVAASASSAAARPPAWIDGGPDRLPSRSGPHAARVAADAGRALASGDARAAADALDRVQDQVPDALSDDARLTLGVARFHLGDPEGAAASLAAIRDPALAAVAAYHRGQALFYAGAPSEAAAVFATVPPTSPGALAAQARRAEALAAAGDPAAVTTYDAALLNGEDAELAFGRARAGADSSLRSSPELATAAGAGPGRPQAGAPGRSGVTALLRDAWRRYPGHPAADLAEPEVIAAAPATADERLDRTARLLAQARPRRALAEAQRGLDGATGTARAALELARGKSLLALHRHGEAERAFLAASADGAGPDLPAEALVLAGRQALRRGDTTTALARFAAAAARQPAAAAADEATFLAAWTRFEAMDFEACRAGFSALIAARPASPRAAELRWYAGFCAFLAGRPADAARELEAVERLYPRSPFAAQAVYWRARALEATDAGTAQRLHRQSVRAAPWSWYAALARERLSALGAAPEPLALPRAAATFGDPGPTAPTGLATRLARAGLLTDADRVLSALARSTPDRAGAEAVAATAASLGLHARAYALANARLWSRAFQDRGGRSVALLYPRAFEDLVEREAGRTGADPYLLWAIMRRESAFEPAARSIARARGLMQLLTRTARRIAQVTARPRPRGRDLYAPETVVPLSAWYVAELVGRFGHPALAAAAYNAGPGPAATWARDRGELPLDAFVECIPYRETRGYVKGVIADYLTYRAVYGEPTPPGALRWTVPKPGPGVEF